MDDVKKMLEQVAAGTMSVEEAVLELKKEPFSAAGFDDLGFAKLDTHRKLRQGAAEVIYGAGKTAEQIGGIVNAMKKRGQQVILITRLDPEKAEAVRDFLQKPQETGQETGALEKRTGRIRNRKERCEENRHRKADSGIFRMQKSVSAGNFLRKTGLAPSLWPPGEPAIFLWRRRRL